MREGEKHECVVAPQAPPDWESDWQPFALQSGVQSTEPHQPEQNRVRSVLVFGFFSRMSNLLLITDIVGYSGLKDD